MIAVPNSSVLIALSSIGKLRLLPDLFPNGIYVPDAVWNEVVVAGQGRPTAEDVAASGWIRRFQITNRRVVDTLQLALDLGEAEAIALCLERDVRVVLLDERQARHTAERLGLTVLGTLGILVQSRRRGLINELRPLIAELTKNNFRMSRSVILMALDAVGE